MRPHKRHWWRDTRGISDYLELAIVIPLVVGAFVGGAMVVNVMAAEGTLHSVAGMADRSLVANGCLTATAVQGIQTTLTAAHLSASRLTLQTQGVSGSQAALYGTSGIGVHLSYPLPLSLPGTPWTVGTPTLNAQVSSDQSQAVPYGAGTGCAAATLVASTFPGTGGTSGGSGAVSLPAVATGVTLSVSPNPVGVGNPVLVSGAVSSNGSPMANMAVQVTLGSRTVTATTNAQGAYQTTITPLQSGTRTVTATAGPASQSQSLTVLPPAPASVILAAPSPEAVGQPFTITGTVLTAAGQAVANGTSVMVASSDASAFPSQTATTQGGTLTVSEPAYTALSPSSVTFTATAGSASGSVAVAVAPGAPQAATITATPTSGTAGNAWTVSGTVTGPDGTPVAAGTPVTISSPNDAQDALPTLKTAANGAYSGSVTLTQAGSVTLTATAGTVQSSPITVTVTPSTPAQAVQLEANPNPVNQGATTILTGTVVDAYGNPVASGTTLTLSSSAWSTPVTATTGTNGGFSVPVVFTVSGSQMVTVTAGSTTLGTLSVQVNQLGAYTLAATQSSTTLTAGQSQAVTFTLTDSSGNPVVGDTLDFSANPASATLSAVSAVTNGQGQGTVTVSPTQSGTLVVTASLVQDNGTTTGTAAWHVRAATPTTVDPPTISPSVVQSTQDGGTQIPVVTGLALDPYGNPVANATVSVSGGWDPGVTATGTTDAEGYFSIPIQPVAVGGPYDPTITVTDSAGSETQTYTNTNLTVVRQLYTLTLASTNGSGSTPAGTPYGIMATLTEYGANSSIPVPNAAITFTVMSNDTATTWAANGATPTPAGPTSIAATTNSAGQVMVAAAFMPGTGGQTMQASFGQDNTVGTLNVTVTPNTPSTVIWDGEYAERAGTTDQVQAGQTLVLFTSAMDAYGFGLSNGQSETYGFDGQSGSAVLNDPFPGWPTYGNSGNVYLVPTHAGTYTPTMTVDGQTFTGNSVTVTPGPLAYIYPVLGPASANGSWISGGSWSAWQSLSQGPTNAYGTRSDPPFGGRAYSIAAIGVDQYGNSVTGWTASVFCTASNGGACPSVPGTTGTSTGWQTTGDFISGSYELSFTPTASPTGMVANPTTTYDTFTMPGLTGWNVLVGNGSSVIGSGGPGTTINLGTLAAGTDQLNFSIEGLSETGSVFTGYTNDHTDQQGVICRSATSGGVCPNGLNQPLVNTIGLGSSGTPDGYTGWSALTTFAPGTYTLSIQAGEYGDAGGQNFTPAWQNTHVTFTVPGFSVITWPAGGTGTLWNGFTAPWTAESGTWPAMPTSGDQVLHVFGALVAYPGSPNSSIGSTPVETDTGSGWTADTPFNADLAFPAAADPLDPSSSGVSAGSGSQGVWTFGGGNGTFWAAGARLVDFTDEYGTPITYVQSVVVQQTATGVTTASALTDTVAADAYPVVQWMAPVTSQGTAVLGFNAGASGAAGIGEIPGWTWYSLTGAPTLTADGSRVSLFQVGSTTVTLTTQDTAYDTDQSTTVTVATNGTTVATLTSPSVAANASTYSDQAAPLPAPTLATATGTSGTWGIAVTYAGTGDAVAWIDNWHPGAVQTFAATTHPLMVAASASTPGVVFSDGTVTDAFFANGASTALPAGTTIQQLALNN